MNHPENPKCPECGRPLQRPLAYPTTPQEKAWLCHEDGYQLATGEWVGWDDSVFYD